jgi:hypothetical protein
MYAPQTAQEIGTSPAGAGGDEAFLTAQQICAKRDGISLMTQCGVALLPPPTVGINCRRYSPLTGRIVGNSTGSGSRNSASRAGSRRHGIRA